MLPQVMANRRGPPGPARPGRPAAALPPEAAHDPEAYDHVFAPLAAPGPARFRETLTGYGPGLALARWSAAALQAAWEENRALPGPPPLRLLVGRACRPPRGWSPLPLPPALQAISFARSSGATQPPKNMFIPRSGARMPRLRVRFLMFLLVLGRKLRARMV